MKKTNKNFSIPASARKKRITDFLKNIWTVRYTFDKLYGGHSEIVMSDQMPSHRNETSNEKALNFKGATETRYLKENHSLSGERIAAMTSLASEQPSSTPNLEFVFKVAGKRVKLNPPSAVRVQWAPKGSCRLEHVLKICKEVHVQTCALFPQKRKIFTLDDYSAHLDPAVTESLSKRGYFLVILPGGITGNLQVNDTDLHHPLKTSHREKKATLMTENLRKHPDKIPSPSRAEIIKMCKTAFAETLKELDVSDTFKRNGLTIKLEGSEDYVVPSKLKALVWYEMEEFPSELLSKPHPTTLKKLEEVMIPTDGVKRKLVDGVIGSVPPDEGYGMLDGELADKEWDKNENDAGTDSEDEDDVTENTVPQNDASPLEDEVTQENESIFIDSELKTDLECLSRIQSVITTEKKISSASLPPFMVRVENF